MDGRALPIIGLIAAATLLVAACGGGDKSAAGSDLADRWLRVGEDLGTGVTVYEGKVPPQLSALLNPGVAADAKDQVALPVHPEGKLVGSFHIRRSDGTNLVWLIFDVVGADAAVEQLVAEQLNQTPWQVIGGQTSEALAVVRFQNTLSGDVEGTAVIQPLPTGTSFDLTVQRAGKDVKLTMPRSAPAPRLAAEVVEQSDGLVVRTLEGFDSATGLQADDRIVSVAASPVKTTADLDRALRALADAGARKASLVYILEIKPQIARKDPTFILPQSRTLPESFPARFLIADTMTVLDSRWSSQGGQGVAYQTTLLTKSSSRDAAQEVRQAIRREGWRITDDQAVGFATQIDFTDAASRITGRARIDAFPADQSFTALSLEMQSTPQRSGN